MQTLKSFSKTKDSDIVIVKIVCQTSPSFLKLQINKSCLTDVWLCRRQNLKEVYRIGLECLDQRNELLLQIRKQNINYTIFANIFKVDGGDSVAVSSPGHAASQAPLLGVRAELQDLVTIATCI